MGQFKERTIISIVGNTNVGKSTLFNLITGQKNKSIVDKTAGTTTDTVKSLMEIHGLGAIKLIDTAGINENTVLGEKKKEKTLKAINVSDIVLFVVKYGSNKLTKDEVNLLNYIEKENKTLLFIYNIFDETKPLTRQENLTNHNFISINVNNSKQLDITNFIINSYKQQNNKHNIDHFLPKIDLYNKYVLLIVPLDEESPENRLIRPQNMVLTRLLNVEAIPVLYNINLNKFRNNSKKEIDNFKKIIAKLTDLTLIITDSQAFDCISDYIPNNINFTSFSIIMTNFMSNGKILDFIKNVKKLDTLKDNDKILMVETCKHDRKCNDIATVQLPRMIKNYNKNNIDIRYNFGESFLTEDELKEYKLIIMCGGCMIDKQNYNNRLTLINSLKIPYTNYGIVMSYIKNSKLLKRCTDIFKKNE